MSAENRPPPFDDDDDLPAECREAWSAGLEDAATLAGVLGAIRHRAATIYADGELAGAMYGDAVDEELADALRAAGVRVGPELDQALAAVLDLLTHPEELAAAALGDQIG